MIFMPQDYNVVLSRIVQETKDVRTFCLKFSDEKGFDFFPGQFVMLRIPSDIEKLKRAYSIASSPTEDGIIDVTFRIEGKFTNKLAGLREGDELVASGPFGHFNFKPDMKDDLVLFAGGTGIAPFRSFVKFIVGRNLPNKVVLFYSSKTPDEIIYFNELREFKKKSKNVKIVFTVTRYDGNDWDGLRGRFDEKMIMENLDGFDNKLFYLCGSNSFVDSVVGILKAKDIPKERIKFEK